MRRDDPPRGPRKPYSGQGPASGSGQGAGQGAGQGPWRSGPRRDAPQSPPDEGRGPYRGGDARSREEPPAPYRGGHERSGHAHPHSRSERREQRHRHGDDARDSRERSERTARPYRQRDEELSAGSDQTGFDDAGFDAPSPQRARRDVELRLYGLNAVRAVFARRPEAIRKLYLDGPRIPQLQPLLSWCVANRVGYRVVETQDLDKLAASGHHEGVVADVLREEPVSLSEWLRDLAPGPQLAIWLDGVGNPHNLGAILRSSAHFGVSAVLLSKDSTLALSGAAARVAEGGAEAVPMVRMGRSDNALAQLRGSGFALAATVVDGGEDVFAAALPQRLVYVLGAEGAGMDRDLAAACDLRLSIPGSGKVESLNVAAATAVLLAAWRARR
ncbi:TrmH family RNA methyltransferase [Pseudomonas sp. CGJS7]|uniref:TrmH family RNA methyltransferase n=1 Tax=Pseudomonas sp. CGJS7 TaxID=3109348 RepID=UPI00300A8BF7